MASFLGVLRVLFVSLLVSVAVAADGDCTDPKVRREWRKLSPDEQSEWIQAMNVWNRCLCRRSGC